MQIQSKEDANHNSNNKSNVLSLVPKLYQSELFSRIKSKSFGLDPSQIYGPEVVEFDPTTACNLGCPECISGKLLGAGGFSRESIQSILDSFVKLGVKAVVLIGGGEPLMHPMTEEIINFLHKNDIHIGITTNGLFIEQYLETIAHKVNWLRVSVDAANCETFGRVRPDKKGKSQFSELIRQMKLLGSHSSRECTFGYSMLILTRFSDLGEVEFTNATEIYEAAKLAKALGCDYFEVKPSFDDAHFHVRQPSDLMAIAKVQLQQAIDDLSCETFSILTATNLFEILDCKPTEQPKSYNFCPVTNLRTLISPSGVFPCPYFRGDVTRSYGNPNHTSLVDIWESPQRKEVQDRLNPSRDCKFHCIRHKTNLELFKLGQGLEVNEADLANDYNRFF
jgi:MoaA/NifB/PqqE/SkfB family radical SAM enzyme